MKFSLNEWKRLVDFWQKMAEEYSGRQLHLPDEKSFWGTASMNADYCRRMRDRSMFGHLYQFWGFR